MRIRRAEMPIFIVNVLYILVFGGMALSPPADREFVIYGLVIILLFVLILAAQRRVEFPPVILWGLTLWGFLHMAGGEVSIGSGRRLYELVIARIFTVGDVTVFRYDHLTHTVGFGVSTLVCFHLLKPYLAERVRSRAVLSVLVALMGMGLGAFNEVLELGVALIDPQSGVGGYYNNAFDLVFNTVGAALAVLLLNVRGQMGSDRVAGDAKDQ
jgi:putative membrane protein